MPPEEEYKVSGGEPFGSESDRTDLRSLNHRRRDIISMNRLGAERRQNCSVVTEATRKIYGDNISTVSAMRQRSKSTKKPTESQLSQRSWSNTSSCHGAQRLHVSSHAQCCDDSQDTTFNTRQKPTQTPPPSDVSQDRQHRRLLRLHRRLHLDIPILAPNLIILPILRRLHLYRLSLHRLP